MAMGGGMGQTKNPFGKFAALRIARKTYDRARAYRFKKNYAKWVPYLLAWDGTLRLISSEARIRRTFRPGFVLDDNVVGEAVERSGGRRFIFIHPDRFAQVAKAHKLRPLAIAAFLHGVAVHELTHADGKMGDGHDEEFIARREDLGAATAHLLPAIAVLVGKLLKVGEPESEDARRVAKLTKELEKERGTVREQRVKIAELNRVRTQRGRGLREGVDAERLLEAVVGLLRARPPVGVDAGYVEGFVARNRAGMLEVVRGAFAGR